GNSVGFGASTPTRPAWLAAVPLPQRPPDRFQPSHARRKPHMPNISRHVPAAGVAHPVRRHVPVGRAAAARPSAGLETITAADPRYHELTTRGYNRRFTAEPEAIFTPRTTGEVVEAVQRAV